MLRQLRTRALAALCIVLALALAAQAGSSAHLAPHIGLVAATAGDGDRGVVVDGAAHPHVHAIDGDASASGADGHDAFDHSHDHGCAIVCSAVSAVALSRQPPRALDDQIRAGPGSGFDRPPRA